MKITSLIATMTVLSTSLLFGKICQKGNDFEADYVVLGVGTAGAEIARILTDDCRTSVIGVEAGPNLDNDPVIQDSSTQTLFLPDLFYPNYFWQTEGIPQVCANLITFPWSGGRLLGGSSSINSEQWVRGTNAVFAQWEALLGHPWTVKNILANYKAIENYNGNTDNSAARGFNGLVNVRQAPQVVPAMAEKFADAIDLATGFPIIEDYNNPDTPLGPFYRWQYTQNPNGTRASSSTSFLKDIMTKDGFGKDGRELRVLLETTALKIIWDGNNAVGAQCTKNGKCFKVFARKKVIISLGIHSAQFLMGSGVGPKNVLEAGGIKVIFNNPAVGQHLKNHFTSLCFFTANPNDPALAPTDPSAFFTAGAFLPSPVPFTDQSRREIFLAGFSFGPGNLTILVIPLQTKTTGELQIQSGDPLRVPLVDEKVLCDDEDIEVLMFAYKKYIQDINTAFQSIDSSYQLEFPTLDIINDDAALEEFIRTTILQTHHFQGTCRMAPLNDGGVVDKFGNVYGTRNLIVADDSNIPFIVDCNTSSTAYLIGRIIAKELKKKH